MEPHAPPKTTTITVYLLAALLIPIAAFFGAEHLEQDVYKSKDAIVFWLVLIALALLLLKRANTLAVRTTGFRSLYSTLFIASMLYAASFGWIARSVWNNTPLFSKYRNIEYTLFQDDKHPNQFLFKGDLSYGAENKIIRTIRGASNVDWNKPIVLEMNSVGGFAKQALVVAEFVKQYDIHVEVIGRCVSACTQVLLASNHRYIHPRAWIGFHAAYALDTNQEPNYDLPSLKFYDDQLDAQLNKLGASDEFRSMANIRDAKGGFFPTYSRLKQEGLANESRRLYLKDDYLPSYL